MLVQHAQQPTEEPVLIRNHSQRRLASIALAAVCAIGATLVAPAHKAAAISFPFTVTITPIVGGSLGTGVTVAPTVMNVGGQGNAILKAPAPFPVTGPVLVTVNTADPAATSLDVRVNASFGPTPDLSHAPLDPTTRALALAGKFGPVSKILDTTLLDDGTADLFVMQNPYRIGGPQETWAKFVLQVANAAGPVAPVRAVTMDATGRVTGWLDGTVWADHDHPGLAPARPDIVGSYVGVSYDFNGYLWVGPSFCAGLSTELGGPSCLSPQGTKGFPGIILRMTLPDQMVRVGRFKVPFPAFEHYRIAYQVPTQ